MNKKELKDIIRQDSAYYCSFPRKERIKMFVTRDHFYMIHRYMTFLRKEEYYREKSQGNKNIFAKACEWFFARKKNLLGNRLGFYIKPNSLGSGTVIYHHGSVIINGGAKLGKNCRLHGNNCIGNNGQSHEAPIIGNNVEIGFGAVIIGDVKIADNVKIGSGAVVVKDCLTEGATLVGVPAHIVKAPNDEGR